VVETKTHLIGIESKRFEPFRDSKTAVFKPPYWREVWGDNMTGYEYLRDRLHERKLIYKHLDAAQLVKHAFGLRTQGCKRDLKPVLAYIYIETIGEKPVKISQDMIDLHRLEISDFSRRVANCEVSFIAFSYSEWLASLTGATFEHAKRVADRFNL
ncbi:MAG: hypothetical protein JKX72_07915, partial [Robiginitomaculum sp.]|nr:hypothetical protein [Robiginitomaculum sp.]